MPAAGFSGVDIFIRKTFCGKQYILIFALPNTKVEGKFQFFFYGFVAQLVEQYTFNVWVLGSSPNGATFNIKAFLQNVGGLFSFADGRLKTSWE